MKGELHLGTPPESIFCNSTSFCESHENMKSVSFVDNFTKTKSINYTVLLDDGINSPTLEFISSIKNITPSDLSSP